MLYKNLETRNQRWNWERPFPSSTTVLISVPIPPSIQTRTSSPCFKKTGGFLTKPTPYKDHRMKQCRYSHVILKITIRQTLGVPVMMMEPGSRVVPCDNQAIVWRTLNIWSLGNQFRSVNHMISFVFLYKSDTHAVFPSCIFSPLRKVLNGSF